MVNDGSSDNSEEICLLYKLFYPKDIIYIRILHGGVSKAKNVGIKYSLGKYINYLVLMINGIKMPLNWFIFFLNFIKILILWQED